MAQTAPDVLLLSDGSFDDNFVSELGRLLGQYSNLVVRPLLATGLDGVAVNERGQLVADDAFDRLDPVITRLRSQYGQSDTTVLVVTAKDINGAAGRGNFLFSATSPTQHLSIVSTARMVTLGADGKPDVPKIIERLMKMMMRAAGELTLKLPRSNDPGSIMYSPITGLDDIDRLPMTLGRAI